MTHTTITLEQFHDLLSDAYAVSVNDTLYFVGYDTDDNPYIADNDGDDYVDLSTVDGDIEVHKNYVFFYIQEQPIQLSFLQLRSLIDGYWAPESASVVSPLPQTTMRKIEAQMNRAISTETDWKSANTEVINIEGVSFVYLYNNLIAMVGDTWLEIFDGGHQTTTTKSRLNAILSEHGTGEYVYQKNFNWFVSTINGEVPFGNGIKLDGLSTLNQHSEMVSNLTDYQHQINIQIAETVEQLQHLNPDLYALRYSQLYSNKGLANAEVWTVKTLHLIEQDLIDNAKGLGSILTLSLLIDVHHSLFHSLSTSLENAKFLYSGRSKSYDGLLSFLWFSCISHQMKIAPISFCKATQHSQNLCIAINQLYRQGYTTQQIAQQLNIGKTAVRYYYYGVHNCSEAHFHWKNAFNANKEIGHIQYSLNQVRVGTSVPI